MKLAIAASVVSAVLAVAIQAEPDAPVIGNGSYAPSSFRSCSQPRQSTPTSDKPSLFCR